MGEEPNIRKNRVQVRGSSAGWLRWSATRKNVADISHSIVKQPLSNKARMRRPDCSQFQRDCGKVMRGDVKEAVLTGRSVDETCAEPAAFALAE